MASLVCSGTTPECHPRKCAIWTRTNTLTSWKAQASSNSQLKTNAPINAFFRVMLTHFLFKDIPALSFLQRLVDFRLGFQNSLLECLKLIGSNGYSLGCRAIFATFLILIPDAYVE